MKHRDRTWLAVIVLGIGGVVAAVLGLFAYMSATATPLHPDPKAVPSAAGATPPDAWTAVVAQARQLARARVSEHNLPGLSVAVGVGGDLVWAEGFGWADVENRVPVTPRTRFKIGMASKVLTSAAVGVLLEKDRLQLDEPIQTYVPEFPKKEWPVTLRQLMTHVAGITTDGGDEGPWTEHCERPVDGLRLFKDDALLFEPGTRYRYSNYDWILVSAAVEAAAGEPFFTFMRKQVLEPLGMQDTMPDSATESVPGRAAFYFPRFAADPRYGAQEPREVDHSCLAGSAAYLSTPSDLVRFGMAINAGTLLQPATVRLLQTSQRVKAQAGTTATETGYGLGWDLETVPLAGKDTPMVGHDGEVMGGILASLMTFPADGIVVAVISNTSYADTAAAAASLAQPFAEQVRRPARQ